MNKVSDKYLRDLLRIIVDGRAGGFCEFPGCMERNCDPAHRWSKSNLSIRYNADACVNLCVHHHTADLFSAHKSPEDFWKFIIESGVRSREWEEEILIIKNKIITIPESQFREKCKFKLLAEKELLAA